jgi:putative membrane protein
VPCAHPPWCACNGAIRHSVGEKIGVNSTLGIAPKTEDFMKQLATCDMFEIQSSKFAQERGDADQKTFAGTMTRTANTVRLI